MADVCAFVRVHVRCALYGAVSVRGVELVYPVRVRVPVKRVRMVRVR